MRTCRDCEYEPLWGMGIRFNGRERLTEHQGVCRNPAEEGRVHVSALEEPGRPGKSYWLEQGGALYKFRICDDFRPKREGA